MLFCELFIHTSVGALAGVKDRGLVVEAVTHGNIDVAKRLLKVAESGEDRLVGGLGARLRSARANQQQHSSQCNLTW